MDEERQNSTVTSSGVDRRQVLRTVLLSAILGSVLVGGPDSVIWYTAGLFNATWPVALILFLFLLTPVILLVLLIHGIRRWHSLSERRRWVYVFLGAICAAFWVPVGLGLCGLPVQSPGVMVGRGFYWYARVKTDVQAIQAWLDTVDPNDCEGQELGLRFAPVGVSSASVPKFIPSPPCLPSLSPRQSNLLLRDDTGRPMVRVSRYICLDMYCGIVVGSRDMPIPKTQEPADRQGDREHGEYRKALAPGAYVWCYLD